MRTLQSLLERLRLSRVMSAGAFHGMPGGPLQLFHLAILCQPRRTCGYSDLVEPQTTVAPIVSTRSPSTLKRFQTSMNGTGGRCSVRGDHQMAVEVMARNLAGVTLLNWAEDVHVLSGENKRTPVSLHRCILGSGHERTCFRRVNL
jgi:hypothetical protein